MKQFLLVLVWSLTWLGVPAIASDHDDGELDIKGRSLNLTDLYVFREDWQDSDAGQDNLVLVMNTNPRSLARQQYYFSSNAHYEFHMTRLAAADKKKRPTGKEDIVIRVKFGDPDDTGHQKFWVAFMRTGQDPKVLMDGTTTALSDQRVKIANGKVDNLKVAAFAGLREDPFFFDVERYFRIRGFLATGVNTLGGGPIQGGANVFRSDATAVDFAAGYNVNSIVLRLPLALLQNSAKDTVFDVWQTISVPKNPAKDFNESVEIFKRRETGFRQIERLARPAIAEGLVISNNLLEAWNALPPSLDLTNQRSRTISSENNAQASSIIAEAGAVLTAVNKYGKGAGLPAPDVGAVVAGFLPDIMRVDVTNSFGPGKWAYNGDAVTVDGNTPGAMLTGGRKLEDDVMDVTLSYLIAGNPACGPSTKCTIPDGVTYSGGTDCAGASTGSNPAAPGHHCLFMQTARNGSAKFPFLAEPN